MNRQAYEAERLRSVHLNILVIMTICVVAISFSGFSLQWQETWMLPFFWMATLSGWMLHIRDMFSPDARLWYYAGVSLMVVVLDGVHATSLFDFAISVVLVLTLFSQTNNRTLLHLCMLIWLFLLGNHIVLLVTGRSVPPTRAVISELAIHTAVVIVAYRIALGIIRLREEDEQTEAREIDALKEMKKHTEDFLTNVSHELRTPINAITGIGSSMMRSAKGEAAAERAAQILYAGRHLSDQVEDMLDYTEIDTGRLRVPEETYAVSSLVNDLVVECSLSEAAQEARITIEVAEGIPERLSGGGRWVRKLLRHQIRHAVQMAETDAVHVLLHAQARDYGVNLRMDVRYRGRAASRKELAEILHTRQESGGRRQRSVGVTALELRIIFGLARAMGGFVVLLPGTEEGVCLRVSIPQRIALDGGAGKEALTDHLVIPIEPERERWMAGQTSTALLLPEGLSALIVDDEPMNLIVAEGILADYGMVTETAESGEEAIRKVRAKDYDLIFMDHMMPVMDGVEAAHRIRDILAAGKRDTRIIALTANAVSGAREMFLREGFDAFIAKPVVRTELERALKGVKLSPRKEVQESES